MGLVNVRIDERLIHGQVAGIWTNTLNTQRIIVANDKAAENPIDKASLRMAAPSTVRLSVITVEAAAKNITSGKYGDQRIFLIFKNPTDVNKFLEFGGSIEELTVGNMSHKDNTTEITKSIYVSNEEKIIFNEINNKGVKIVSQLVPNESAIDFMKKLTEKIK